MRSQRIWAIIAGIAGLIGAGIYVAGPAQASIFYTELRNSHSNKCVDVANKSLNAGAIVHQWSCAHDDNQLWTTEPQPDGTIRLRNARSQLCMEPYSPDLGSPIVQRDCDIDLGFANWTVWQDGSLFKLYHPGSGMCLDLNNGSTSNGAKVQIWYCNTASNAQHWYFS